MNTSPSLLCYILRAKYAGVGFDCHIYRWCLTVSNDLSPLAGGLKIVEGGVCLTEGGPYNEGTLVTVDNYICTSPPSSPLEGATLFLLFVKGVHRTQVRMS